eukprot:TRINITY_DN35669_c0_g1_i1.p1 TRINITY_DN35669_c0_g1~~TRINITY_DN35669_c0_g1_i1.p1  ORF type:complete len:251 (+),score=28.01 TRINITY_DN35669_c0_g1_i1:69-755(+)
MVEATKREQLPNVCWHWRRGRCASGQDKCKFLHPPELCAAETQRDRWCRHMCCALCPQQPCRLLHLEDLLKVKDRDSVPLMGPKDLRAAVHLAVQCTSQHTVWLFLDKCVAAGLLPSFRGTRRGPSRARALLHSLVDSCLADWVRCVASGSPTHAAWQLLSPAPAGAGDEPGRRRRRHKAQARACDKALPTLGCADAGADPAPLPAQCPDLGEDYHTSYDPDLWCTWL